jgi:hypothetical protein
MSVVHTAEAVLYAEGYDMQEGDNFDHHRTAAVSLSAPH